MLDRSSQDDRVERLSSSPLKATAKLELITEQLLMKKTGNNQKRSSTANGIKKEPQRDGVDMQCIQDPSSQGDDPQMGE